MCRKFSSLESQESWDRPRLAPRPERLDAPLDSLKGVGTQVQRKLRGLGLVTVRDLLEHGPRRYESAVPERSICDLLSGEECVVSVAVKSARTRRVRRLTILTASVDDGTGHLNAIWFNQDWLLAKLTPGPVSYTHLRAHET